MSEPQPNRLATLLRGAAALALGLLLLGTATWTGQQACRQLGVLLLLVAPWMLVAHAAWVHGRSGRPASAALALTLLAAAAAALVLGLG